MRATKRWTVLDSDRTLVVRVVGQPSTSIFDPIHLLCAFLYPKNFVSSCAESWTQSICPLLHKMSDEARVVALASLLVLPGRTEAKPTDLGKKLHMHERCHLKGLCSRTCSTASVCVGCMQYMHICRITVCTVLDCAPNAY